MYSYLFRRLAGGLAVLAVVSVVVFGVFFALPADPARLACGKGCTPDLLKRIRHSMEIDQPLIVQYERFAKGLFAGRTYNAGTEAARACSAPCLGFSFQTDEEVTALIKDRVPATFSIAVGASALWLLLGVTLGFISAIRRGTWIDKVSQGIALAGASLQLYFVGLVLLLLFVDKLQWLPFPAYNPPGDYGWGEWAMGLILPWATLALLLSAIYARLTRAGMLETLSEDFVRTARAKGVSRWRLNTRHAFRAAMTPIATVFGLDVGTLLGGAVITEYVFNIPGLGKLSTESVSNVDLPVIVGVVMTAAFFIVIANIVVDLVYAFLDPKVRLS